MKFAKIIQENKELSELPFLIVFRTLQILNDIGMLKVTEGGTNVD